MVALVSEQVWSELENNMFAVVGMVTAKNESRTAGIVYAVRNRKLYFGTLKESWKARHIAANGHVSVTVPIAKRIPFVPWVRFLPRRSRFRARPGCYRQNRLTPRSIGRFIAEWKAQKT